jgi:hypothetical protein
MPIIRTKRTKFTAILFISLILGLTACSSKKSALGLIQKQKDGRWFCTPQGSEEWLCQESDSEFKELGKEQRKQSSLKATESSAEATAEKTTESSELSSVETIETTKRVVAEVASAERTEIESFEAQSTEAQSSEDEEAAEVNAINSPQDASQNESAEPDNKSATDTGGNQISVPESVESEISPWVIQLAAYQHQSSADSLSGEIEGSQLFNTRVKGRDYISVVVTGFESRWQAQQRAEEIKQEYPKLAPWVRQGADFKKYIIR